MARVVAIIDGFNLYHSLMEGEDRKKGRPGRYEHYRWLDYTKLVKCFLKTSDSIAQVIYCTAFPTWNPSKTERHRSFVEVQKKLGVEVLLGSFHKKDRMCRNCRVQFPTHEEKQTDVNVAVKLFEMAHNDIYDTALLITGDSDICPAIRAVRRSFPEKNIEVVIPINRQAEELKQIATRTHKIKEYHLSSSLLPAEVLIHAGRKVACPPGWMPKLPPSTGEAVTIPAPPPHIF